MKIGIVSALYPPVGTGGAETVAEAMAQGFRSRGHDVFIVTSERYRSFRSFRITKEVRRGIRAYSWFPLNVCHYTDGFRTHAIIRALWRVADIFNVHSYVQLRNVLRLEKPDSVITHNLTGFGFLTPLALRKSETFHAHVIHDVQLYEPSGILYPDREHSRYRFFGWIGYRALMRALFGRVSLVIAPSHLLLSFYQRHGYFKKSATHIAPSPVVLEERVKEKTYDGVLHILYIGHLSEAKGAVGLVSVLMRLGAESLKTTIIGSGEAEVSLKKGAEIVPGKIVFIGTVPHDALQDYFFGADVVVVPSVCYDAFPTVALEALRSGVPVIASDSTGAVEVLKEGSNGWIVPSGDWRRLESLLVELSHNPERVLAAKRQTCASVRHLTVDSYCDSILEAIRIQKRRYVPDR